ncbi:MAG: hypothetical protein JOZ67_12510 [Gammaproteobacteria bacterium]|nr:hypothetical protein [Gammaproteobacteria bacterium]MBV9696027.1 hypothetical protein [Gammaproteobacteria bacterium]
MSASDQQRAEWLDTEFWERLDRLEQRHQRLQSDHDVARRGLEGLGPQAPEELRQAWRNYCEVIEELDQTSAEIASLHR